MARTDNLRNFLTDVSNAIKEKKQDTTPIKASDFDTEIINLPSGGGGDDVSNYLKSVITDDNREGFFNGGIFKRFPTITLNTNTLQKVCSYYQGTFLPYMDTSNVTNMANMCEHAEKLISIPEWDYSNTTSISNIFTYCDSLQNIPDFDAPTATTGMNAFSHCGAVSTIGNINIPSCKTMSSMFSYMTNLVSMGTVQCDSATTLTTILSNTKILVDCGGFINLGKAYTTTAAANYSSYRLDISACTSLSEESLINILNGVYDIASKGCKTQSIIMGTVNKGKLTSPEGIEALANATTKGWTVS